MMSWWIAPTAVLVVSILLAVYVPAHEDGFGVDVIFKTFLVLLVSLVAFIVAGALK